MNDLTNWMLPACRVHVGQSVLGPQRGVCLSDWADPANSGRKPDQSPRAVVHRVQLQLQDEAPYLLQGRVRIIK